MQIFRSASESENPWFTKSGVEREILRAHCMHVYVSSAEGKVGLIFKNDFFDYPLKPSVHPWENMNVSVLKGASPVLEA